MRLRRSLCCLLLLPLCSATAEPFPGDHLTTPALSAQALNLDLRAPDHIHSPDTPAPQLPITQHADFHPLQRLRSALDVLQTKWFELWVGQWPTSIDWTGAVLNTHLVASLSTLSNAQHAAKTSLPTHASAPFSDLDGIENEIGLYFAHTAAYYFGQNDFAIRNQAYDDMLWVVLSWLDSISFIGTHSRLHHRSLAGDSRPWHGAQFIPAFAHRARIFYDITTRGWSTDHCGGGMTWNPSLEPYKNAITNQLYIAASVAMYLDFPGDANDSPFLASADPHEPRYLHAAIAGYDWLKSSNMTNHLGLYVDGFHITYHHSNASGGGVCDARNEMLYTYNQGVILSGLRGLWEATGNLTYLLDAHTLVRNTQSATGWLVDQHVPPSSTEWAGLGRAGILEDLCDASATCDQNGHAFKAIYFHHLTLFCDSLPSSSRIPGKTHAASADLAALHRQSCLDYALWVAHNARAADGTRDKHGRVGAWWGAGLDLGASPQPARLPRGAVDYRNNPSELLGPPWVAPNPVDGGVPLERGPVVVPGVANPFARALRPVATTSDGSTDDSTDLDEGQLGSVGHPYNSTNLDEDRLGSGGDPNDRGRGRTVESHSGGVAVMRALWELMNVSHTGV